MNIDIYKKYDILVVIDHYLPGRLSGGPVTTLSNMLSYLSNNKKFLVVTQNFDIDGSIYKDIETNKIYEMGGYDVVYLHYNSYKSKNIFSLFVRSNAQKIYLNSFFAPSSIKILFCVYFKRLSHYIILAPRGEFSSNALRIKRIKKFVYLTIFKIFNIKSRISAFHASSEIEKNHIKSAIGDANIKVAPDMTDRIDLTENLCNEDNVSHKFVFISRIARMKNLKFALKIYSQVPFPVELDIYGPIEDNEYWKECVEIIKNSDHHLKVNYKGSVNHDEIALTFSKYKAFLFPTLGENYGHVIFESLSAGCPVIISDNTPWSDIEDSAVGWIIPLEDVACYIDKVSDIVNMDSGTRKDMGERCRKYALKIANDPNTLESNLSLFA